LTLLRAKEESNAWYAFENEKIGKKRIVKKPTFYYGYSVEDIMNAEDEYEDENTRYKKKDYSAAERENIEKLTQKLAWLTVDPGRQYIGKIA
jgi:hypothetical protein